MNGLPSSSPNRSNQELSGQARVYGSDDGGDGERIDAALERAKQQGELPRIVEANYHPERNVDLFVIKVRDDRRLIVPREDFRRAMERLQSRRRTFPPRQPDRTVWWPKLDEGLHLSGLLEHRYGKDRWMAKLERRGVAA